MKRVFPIVVLVAVVASAGGAGAVPSESEVRAKLAGIEVPFMANEGQADEGVALYARTFAGTVFVTKNASQFAMHVWLLGRHHFAARLILAVFCSRISQVRDRGLADQWHIQRSRSKHAGGHHDRPRAPTKARLGQL